MESAMVELMPVVQRHAGVARRRLRPLSRTDGSQGRQYSTILREFMLSLVSTRPRHLVSAFSLHSARALRA